MNPIDENKLLLELVTVVEEFAKTCYNLCYGWQEIVLCWTRQEIFDELLKQKITTRVKALEHFGEIARIRSEYAKEIESTAW